MYILDFLNLNVATNQQLFWTPLILIQTNPNLCSKHLYFHWLRKVKQHTVMSSLTCQKREALMPEEIITQCSRSCHLSEFTIKGYLENMKHTEYVCYHTVHIPDTIISSIQTDRSNFPTIMFLPTDAHWFQAPRTKLVESQHECLQLPQRILQTDKNRKAFFTLTRPLNFFNWTCPALTKATKELPGVTLH